MPRTAFKRALQQHTRKLSTEGRRWLFVPYDQLSDAMGPLHREPAREVGIVLIETTWKPAQRAYHKQKLALILANMRHFALEQSQRGVAVHHVASDQPYGAVLAQVRGELGDIACMRPAERELHVDIEPQVRWLPHAGWLSQPEDFRQLGKPPWRMDKFYRHMRRSSGYLMDGGKPRGGKWSFDPENRKRWTGEPPAPAPPRYVPDAITREVGELVQTRFAKHPGTLDLEALPATQADAEATWHWALQACLPMFGPFEDAMSSRSRSLFHTRISPLLNLHRLLPRRVLDDAVGQPNIPLASLEGFVRQILGWREFVHHVYTMTDGLRRVPTRNYFAADAPLPPAYWGKPTGLHCLDSVVADVWREGYSHHITRLMVLSNIATLLGFDPQGLSDWFWEAYVDAYDWVVEPNVLGMGTHALGPLMMTKPYISGAAYIHKMSDYCQSCAFKPQKDCPITPWYWAFLAQHAELLRDNARMQIPLQGLRRRDDRKLQLDAAYRAWGREVLGRGGVLRPQDAPT